MHPFVADVLGLVLPQECVGCGAWDTALCPGCRDLLDVPPQRCEQGALALATGAEAESLPVWSLVPYSGAVRGILLAWKRGGSEEVARAVVGAGRLAGRRWAADLAPIVPPGALWLLPAPSGWRRRATGRFVVGEWARAVGEGLADAGLAPRVVVADVLRRGSGRVHQAGLGVAGRAANRRHGTRVVRSLPPAATCLLVDDVLTTGATLAGARAALVAAGYRVAAGLVVAATPDPRRPG